MSGNSRSIPVQIIRKTSLENFNEQIVTILDETEKRVEHLRESASLLEQEKDALLDFLNNLCLKTDLLRLEQGDREDINATATRLLNRCRAVEIVINTPRSAEQALALNNINSLIESAINKLQNEIEKSHDVIQHYLNACEPEQPNGPIDLRFQSELIECTADDQKKIRRRLANILAQIERAQKVCFPEP